MGCLPINSPWDASLLIAHGMPPMAILRRWGDWEIGAGGCGGAGMPKQETQTLNTIHWSILPWNDGSWPTRTRRIHRVTRNAITYTTCRVRAHSLHGGTSLRHTEGLHLRHRRAKLFALNTATCARWCPIDAPIAPHRAMRRLALARRVHAVYQCARWRV